MPRRSRSRSGSRSRSRSRSSGGGRSSSGIRSPPPKPVAQSAPPAPIQRPNRSKAKGLGASIADGIAWGTGIAVAHRIVDGIMGPRVMHHESVASSAPAALSSEDRISKVDACEAQAKAFEQCLDNHGSDISKCQFYMDMMQECRRSSGGTLNA